MSSAERAQQQQLESAAPLFGNTGVKWKHAPVGHYGRIGPSHYGSGFSGGGRCAFLRVDWRLKSVVYGALLLLMCGMTVKLWTVVTPRERRLSHPGGGDGGGPPVGTDSGAPSRNCSAVVSVTTMLTTVTTEAVAAGCRGKSGHESWDCSGALPACTQLLLI